jgi:TRAP-type C4-dicarboxylate transport system permease small subunit
MLDTIAKRIADLCQWFLCGTIALMTVITFIEVVRRYFLGVSFPWAEELIRFLLVWTTFLGGSAAFYHGNLICFDMLTTKLPPAQQTAVSVASALLIFVILGVFFYTGLAYAFSRPIQFQRSPGLNLPMVYVYISIPVSMGLMLFFNFCSLLRLWRHKAGNREIKPC